MGEADIYRVDCRACGRVRTEQVPWARPTARHTSDFENMVAWLAQRMDKTGISRLLRCSWETVDAIVTRVVADHIDDARLGHLYRIGVDEISYKRGHKFLTIVVDHDTGNVVWVGKQRSKAAFEQFFTSLGSDRAAAIEAISLDGSSIYLPVTREQIPQARICLDPFHVIKWTNEVVESVYRAEAPAPAPDCPRAGTGDAPGSRSAPAANTSTSTTTRSLARCGVTAEAASIRDPSTPKGGGLGRASAIDGPVPNPSRHGPRGPTQLSPHMVIRFQTLSETSDSPPSVDSQAPPIDATH
ncbi:transposase [Asanoa sp. NPDC050611]|uniref:transposase n=1 Tax=Asanoa sp. NPDC050611 TaxID=3157098 RepID=UPI00340D10A9